MGHLTHNEAWKTGNLACRSSKRIATRFRVQKSNCGKKLQFGKWNLKFCQFSGFGFFCTNGINSLSFYRLNNAKSMNVALKCSF